MEAWINNGNPQGKRRHTRTHARRTTTDTGLLKRSGADLSRARWTLTGQSVKGD